MVNWLERAQLVFRENPDRPTAVTDDRALHAPPETGSTADVQHQVVRRANGPSRDDDDVLEWLRTEPRKAAKALVCFACHERRFWHSIYGVTICAKCHPPATDRLVDHWVDGVEGRSS